MRLPGATIGLICLAAIAAEPSLPTLVEMIPAPGDGKKYWPRWRGPSGQGIAEGSGYPDAWSDQENVIWKTELPGRGNSSPILWGDRIFLTTAYESGLWPLYKVRRAILCLRRDNGKLLWEAVAPDASPERANRKNGYASGTPATDGERIYAYLGSHGLLCVDFNGKQVWHREIDAHDAYHGTACSPLLYRDRVII